MTEDKKEEKMMKCEKCGKEKNKSEDKYVLEDRTFCCKNCCGDPEKEEHKEKSENVCKSC